MEPQEVGMQAEKPGIDVKRRLLIIPIVHSEQEMGSLAGDIGRVFDETFGADQRDKHRREVKEFWDRLFLIVRTITEIVDPGTIQIYQDGMPVGGELGKRVIREGAESGIPNNILVNELIQKGATLMQTEEPALLKEEYELLTTIFRAPSQEEREQYADQYKHRLYELTIDRDRGIARLIDQSLVPGMLGIMFIGATHQVQQYIAPDIDVYTCQFDVDAVISWITGQTP